VVLMICLDCNRLRVVFDFQLIGGNVHTECGIYGASCELIVVATSVVD